MNKHSTSRTPSTIVSMLGSKTIVTIMPAMYKNSNTRKGITRHRFTVRAPYSPHKIRGTSTIAASRIYILIIINSKTHTS